MGSGSGSRDKSHIVHGVEDKLRSRDKSHIVHGVEDKLQDVRFEQNQDIVGVNGVGIVGIGGQVRSQVVTFEQDVGVKGVGIDGVAGTRAHLCKMGESPGGMISPLHV